MKGSRSGPAGGMMFVNDSSIGYFGTRIMGLELELRKLTIDPIFGPRAV